MPQRMRSTRRSSSSQSETLREERDRILEEFNLRVERDAALEEFCERMEQDEDFWWDEEERHELF